MNDASSAIIRAALPLLAALFLQPGFAAAQYPVNTQVNTGQYGNYVPNGTLHYTPQFQLMPSEQRFAIERSGITPSELRANMNVVGPLTPNGILSYIPPRSELQQIYHLPAPQLYNPAYDLQDGRTQTYSLPPPQSPAASIRYGGQPGRGSPSPYAVSPEPIGQPIFGAPPEVVMPEGTVTYSLSTIRYGRPTSRPSNSAQPPATRPSTAPPSGRP